MHNSKERRSCNHDIYELYLLRTQIIDAFARRAKDVLAHEYIRLLDACFVNNSA